MNTKLNYLAVDAWTEAVRLTIQQSAEDASNLGEKTLERLLLLFLESAEDVQAYCRRCTKEVEA